MSDPATVMQDTQFEGYVTVSSTDTVGMITLRGDFNSKTFATAIKKALGIDLPHKRQIVQGGKGTAAWMSPDEFLIFCAWEEKTKLIAGLEKVLGKRHAMVVDVSDARTTFTLSGPNVREVIAKLAPVDLAPDEFEPGEVRRTRFGQIAAAFWLVSKDEAKVICFRSVADYMFKQLSAAATPGSELDIWT